MAPQEDTNVSPATDEDRALATITMAFSNDPVARWFLPDANSYLTYFPQVLRAFGGAAFANGTAHAIEDYSGAALWLPPGVAPDEEAIGPVMDEGVDPDMQEEAFGFMERMGEYHLTEPHWYLPFIGVDVTKQGRGYGSAQVRFALERCDANGTPAYLEATSPAGKKLYERHGFKELGVIQVGSSPPLWPMQRNPG
jgi:ribosomal protein S18 acetylase RimI-like enzyme